MLTIDIERLRLPAGSRVLDLGCGSGRHARALRLLRGVSAVAVDIQADEVAAAATSLRAMDAGDPMVGTSASDAGPWLVVQGNSYWLPFRDGAFDCVIASEVLEHLHDDNGALREITRVLRPGGQLAVSVPRWMPEVICWRLSSEYARTEGGHVRIYRRRALRQRLSAHGYRIVAGHFAHALHAPYWWLKCAVGLDKEYAALVQWYHKLLVWDLLRKPRITGLMEWVLNPFIGKSVVLYARKGTGSAHVTVRASARTPRVMGAARAAVEPAATFFRRPATNRSAAGNHRPHSPSGCRPPIPNRPQDLPSPTGRRLSVEN